MNRSEIIEKLCNLILDDPAQKPKANDILTSLMKGQIDVLQAVERYNDLINSKPSYWVGKLKPKAVYESLKKYTKGNQDSLDTSKMISSLITHAIIEMQHNSAVTQQDLGVPELITLLKESLSGERHLEEFRSQMDSVLKKYGYLDEKEGE